ncbi:MAG TPA: pantoate--beta-alanine ligase [Candidatus Kapabacteria bacterium]|nr:pantoate--beta-alanine ligase [Candidatus Kapabacteria bacterium]
MNIVESIAGLRDVVRRTRRSGARIGFVPTMGYLHAGHLSLVSASRSAADFTVASIYVNPTQFAPGEDLSRYPRDPEGDRAKLEAAGCDLLYMPSPEEIYPEGYGTFVDVEGITARYEGAFRPDHFRGVATIVAKLFMIVAPDVAVFGQKDAQQAAVVRRMIADLHFDIELLVCPTMRDPDGLAMSSRNVYLSADEREQALSISRGLRAAKAAIDAGASIQDAESSLRQAISPAFAVDYADIIDAATFQRAASPGDRLLAVFAGRIGSTRLIDNLPLRN